MAKILVVDDDVEIIETLKIILESKGYGVVAAGNGADGLKKARSEKPDLILLDVMMAHDREGFEVAQKLKQEADTRHIPVIIITGITKSKKLPFKFEPDEDWLPVCAVLEKPVKPELLLAKIEELLAARTQD
jgi:CheY-like chemotaxis protein